LKPDNILAVIVSYNDAAALSKCVESALLQTGHVHVVDNNSNLEVQNLLDTFQCSERVTICKFTDNHGIASALNEGVRKARELKYEWLLTMDQDSELKPGMILSYCEYLKKNPHVESLTPSIENFNRRNQRDQSGEVGYAISSGNLVRMDVFKYVGGYNDSLFIDGVDFEFSLRLRGAGMVIHRVENALMVHRLGNPVANRKIFGRIYTSHSPLRRYYMSRNLLYLTEWYGLKFPSFIFRLLIISTLSFFAIAIYGPCRFESFKLMGLGLLDFLRRRLGPLRIDN
jgi:rhamnosyltransferase